MTWFAPDALFDGAALRAEAMVEITHGVITQIATRQGDAAAIKGTLSAGFVDLQVNGGGGVMVNTTPATDGLRQIAQAHHALGTVAILPTVITDHPDVLDAAADAVIAVKDAAILGLHIEGPHIAVTRRGTHAADFIRRLDQRTLDAVKRIRAHGLAVMITIAPEAATPDRIRALTAMGACVSLGHTDATADQIHTAIAAGARCGTHLFNAMSQMTGRVAGTVGALINSHCHIGIICDGHHVGDDMIALAIRARPAPDLMFLVSDAMATVGGPDTFDLYGQTITLKDGKLVNADENLAGAHVSQAMGVKRLVNHVGITLEAALRMAITTPAVCIGRPDLANLVGRSVLDVIVLDNTFDASPLSQIV